MPIHTLYSRDNENCEDAAITKLKHARDTNYKKTTGIIIFPSVVTQPYTRFKLELLEKKGWMEVGGWNLGVRVGLMSFNYLNA